MSALPPASASVRTSTGSVRRTVDGDVPQIGIRASPLSSAQRFGTWRFWNTARKLVDFAGRSLAKKSVFYRIPRMSNPCKGWQVLRGTIAARRLWHISNCLFIVHI
jgi:hypothetical protein